MNVDNKKVLQQSVLLIYTVLPCQWLEEIFTKIHSPKPRQHARKVVSVFKDKESEGERRGEGKEEEMREWGRDRDLPSTPGCTGETVSSKMKKACHFFFHYKELSSEFQVGLEKIPGTCLISVREE